MWKRMRVQVTGLALLGMSLGVGTGHWVADAANEDATIMTFTSSTIERIDAADHHLTFRTQEGQSWSLPVTNEDLLKGLSPGDRVSLELDASDRVKNVIKGDGQTRSSSPAGESP